MDAGGKSIGSDTGSDGQTDNADKHSAPLPRDTSAESDIGNHHKTGGTYRYIKASSPQAKVRSETFIDINYHPRNNKTEESPNREMSHLVDKDGVDHLIDKDGDGQGLIKAIEPLSESGGDIFENIASSDAETSKVFGLERKEIAVDHYLKISIDGSKSDSVENSFDEFTKSNSVPGDNNGYGVAHDDYDSVDGFLYSKDLGRNNVIPTQGCSSSAGSGAGMDEVYHAPVHVSNMFELDVSGDEDEILDVQTGEPELLIEEDEITSDVAKENSYPVGRNSEVSSTHDENLVLIGGVSEDAVDGLFPVTDLSEADIKCDGTVDPVLAEASTMIPNDAQTYKESATHPLPSLLQMCAVVLDTMHEGAAKKRMENEKKQTKIDLESGVETVGNGKVETDISQQDDKSVKPNSADNDSEKDNKTPKIRSAVTIRLQSDVNVFDSQGRKVDQPDLMQDTETNLSVSNVKEPIVVNTGLIEDEDYHHIMAWADQCKDELGLLTGTAMDFGLISGSDIEESPFTSYDDDDIFFDDEREDVQKKTFTKWINSQLSKAGLDTIQELFTDLRDGTRLLDLLHVLSGLTLTREKGRMRVHQINNVNTVLDLLSRQYNIKLVNISSNDIVDGSQKLTLGLVWSIILHWQVKDVMKDLMDDLRQTNLERTLLLWCRQSTEGYADVDVKNFTTSWRTGLAFNALIHKYRPELFRYETLVGKSNEDILEHAFTTAFVHLGVDNLLDPEDVNVDHPDKKSIMMYLMCLFKVLPHSDIPLTDESDTPLSPVSPESISATVTTSFLESVDKSKLSTSLSTSSSRQSTMSSGSVDLLSYQDSLENVLTWLLEAEEVIETQKPIADTVTAVKAQFTEHEEFMLELTKHQDSIGSVLREGNDLITGSRVKVDEENEIRVQMGLLNNRWEELRLKALDRQSKLQQVLMLLQQQQLDSLADWLLEMEKKIGKQAKMGADLEAVRRQVDEHKGLQAELDQQQRKVDSLQNMVVVVDDNNTEQACEAMENQLQFLGKRWASICHWTEEQWLLLQEVLLKWQHFAEEEVKFADWLGDKEAVLNTMKTADLSNPKVSVVQVQELKKIERDMVKQVQNFEALYECGQQIVSCVNNDLAVQKISSLLEDFQDRWKQLVETMEQQSKKIVSLGVELGQIAEISEDQIDSATDVWVTSASHSDAKKRKHSDYFHAEFEAELRKMYEWFERIESGLELLTQEEFSEEEQLVLVEDTQSDVDSQQEDIQKLVTLGKSVVTDLKAAGEPFDAVTKTADELESRWEKLKALLAETRLTVDVNVETKRLYDELHALHEVLATHEKWVGVAETVPEEAADINKHLEQCKIKLKAMKTQGERRDKMNEHADNLRKLAPSHKIHDELLEFNKRWKTTFQLIGERRQRLTEALDKAPPKAYLEAMAALLQWLHNNEQLLLAEPFVVKELVTMEMQMKHFRTLREDLREQKSSKDYLNHTGNELIGKAPSTERAEKLEGDLQKVNKLWTTVSAAMEERIASLEQAIGQLKEYESQRGGLMRWMEEMDVFLHAEDPTKGDLPTLQAQLQESSGVQDDIHTLQKNMDNLNHFYRGLSANINPTFGSQLGVEVQELNTNWNKVLAQAEQQHDRLQGSLDVTEEVYKEIEAIIMWLEPIQDDLANKDYAVVTANDLLVKNKKFRTLKIELEDREHEVNKLNEEANEMLSTAPSGSLQDLARSLMRMNNLWTHIFQTVNHYARLFSASDQQWKQFKVTLDEEQRYLDRLESKIHRSSTSNADAEDISENLDDLESFISQHTSENRAQIEELKQEMIVNSIMEEHVKHETEHYVSRLDQLKTQGKDAIQGLESSISQAQQIERQQLQMGDWMDEVTREIQNRLDADVLAGDVPEEHEQMKEEFRQQETTLQALETQAKEFTSQGRLEAANRLEFQIQRLKRQLSDLTVLFMKFERPADFEPKQSHVKRELDNIQERIYLLDVHHDDLDSLQEKHDMCMKFYTTMSELKSEVEYVIKTGRQIVEKRQVDFPDRLSKELDALKQQYNVIGSQVTEGKTKIEKALKLTKKLRKETVAVQDFINRSNHELDARELIVANYKVDRELAFAKATHDEMMKRQSLLPSMRELTDQLVDIIEDGQLTETRTNLDNLAAQWTQLTDRLTSWMDRLQVEMSEVDGHFVEFQGRLMTLKDWLTATESTLATHNNLPAEQQITQEWTDKLKALQCECGEKHTHVDEVRDAAVEVISKSERHTSLVEPELTHLNQRWTELVQGLKEKITSQESGVTADVVKTTITKSTVTTVMDSGVEKTVETKYVSLEQSSDVPIKFHTLHDGTLALLDAYQRQVICNGDILPKDVVGDLQDNAKNIDVNVQKLAVRVDGVVLQGDGIAWQLDDTDNPECHRIREEVTYLKEVWEKLKSDAERKRKNLVIIVPEWHQFQERVSHLDVMFDAMEANVKVANINPEIRKS